MKKAKKSRIAQDRLPDRSSELLINQRILSGVRDEPKTDIRSHDRRFDSIDKRFESIDKRFESIDAKLLSHDAQFQALNKKIDSVGDHLSADIQKVSADVQKVSADVHRVISLVEEQENRNRAVLDGYQSLYDRQDRVEGRVDELTNTISNLKKISK